MADRFLICEGDTDREVFVRVPGSQNYAILPDKPKPCATEPRSGDRSAVEDAVRLLRQGVPRVVLALDLNAKSEKDVYSGVERAVRTGGLEFTGADGSYVVGSTDLRVIPVGLRNHADLAAFGIASNAIDDFLVILLRDQQTYDRVMKSNRRPAPDHATAIEAVRKSVETIRSLGVTGTSSKQVTALLRAVMNYPASLARFAEAVLRAGDADLVNRTLRPLEDALR